MPAPDARPDPAPERTGARSVGNTAQHGPADPRTLRDVAVRVGTQAAEVVTEARAAAVHQVDTKSSETDVVTSGDQASERFVRRLLAELRPGEPVLGEEEGSGSGSSGASDVGGVGGEEPVPGIRWVVDPIDGTVNYLYGYPAYAVSVAAEHDGVAVAGAVVDVVSGRVFAAARGHGAHLDGVPLRASACTRLPLCLLATGFNYGAERRQRQAAMVAAMLADIRDVRRSGSAALDLCAVAAGWVDAYVEHGLHRWDFAAAALIAEEAGAVVCPPGTAPDLGAGAVFAAAPGVAADIRAALGRAGAAAV